MSPKIKCLAPVFDLSGYGSWSRTYISMLIDLGYDISIGTDINNKQSAISYDPVRADYGITYPKLANRISSSKSNEIVINWLTPDCAAYQSSQEKKGVKKIIMTLWETSNLPEKWIPMLSLFDEIWLPGPWNKKIFERSFFNFMSKYSGFSKLKNIPIKTIPYPAEPSIKNKKIDNLLNIPTDTFNFYAISQWSERKNFQDLIYTYLSTFTSKDNTCLILKTHLKDFTQEDKNFIVNELKVLINSTGLSDIPNIILIHKALSSEEIESLHSYSNCYLSASRGEGLGLGMLESALYNNPVITHNFGEQSLYFNDSNLIYEHQLGPVNGRSNPILYKANQQWAYPIYKSFKDKMIEAYSNSEYYKKDAQTRSAEIIKKYNTSNISNLIKESI